ncbi:MAG: hypothetical protein Q4A01_03520 [Coriobacteriales bacterium]|nr:hypothetical protein [Coriobacteriales bacterium]
MKRGLVWMMSTMMAFTLGTGLAACNAPAPTDEPKQDVVETKGDDTKTDDTTSQDTGSQTEKPHGVAINLSDDSILTFDGSEASTQLVEDMRAGKTPKSCTVRYDQMGARPTVTVTDARTIRDVYKKLARMHVGGTTNMSVTDSYHLVSFELQDGTVVSFDFEGEDILVRKDQNYAVADEGNLWPYVRELQDDYVEEQNASPDALTITLEDDKEIVAKCPKSAVPGETVQVKVYCVEDADRHISVNNDENYGDFVSVEDYEFVMPNKPVTVRAWLSFDYPGA